MNEEMILEKLGRDGKESEETEAMGSEMAKGK